MYFCLFCAGLHNRQVGSHMMNDHSSRSHSMLTVYLDIESVRLTFIFDTLSSPETSLCRWEASEREKRMEYSARASAEERVFDKQTFLSLEKY